MRDWPSQDPPEPARAAGCRRLIWAYRQAKRRRFVGWRRNGTSNAQSSSLAYRSSGRSKSEIPNGLGSEFVFGAPREFTSAMRMQSHRWSQSSRSCGDCLCN